MKILTAEQIREVDALTIEQLPISSLGLMEQAASAFVAWFIDRYSPKSRVVVVCGTGNNGGDGLAISRLLLEKNYEVEVFVIRSSGGASDDFIKNEERLSNLLTIQTITESSSVKDLSNSDIIIDAIFGSGLSRPVEGLYANVIEAINASKALVVAVDIASGLLASRPVKEGAIIRPDHTVSFQIPKLAFFMPENEYYTGSWHMVDIGLAKAAIADQSTEWFMIDQEMIKPLIKRRNKYAHKGTHGKGLIMAGSYGKMGAALLSARAALRAGIGLLTMYIPRCGYDIMQGHVPEAMVISDEGDHYLTSYAEVSGYGALGIGPGIGREKETMYGIMQAIQNFDKPVVVDADGLNIISDHREILELLPEYSILTPHPKEFERLVGAWDNDYVRLEKQVQFSKENKVIVVLKGAHTSITMPEGIVYFNTSGNPGMATGGSGDVLTGVLTSLLAQGYAPAEASLVGVYLHGLAADIVAEQRGQIGMIASDLANSLPMAYRELSSN